MPEALTKRFGFWVNDLAIRFLTQDCGHEKPEMREVAYKTVKYHGIKKSTYAAFRHIPLNPVVVSDGTLLWFTNKKTHRTDGPAVIKPDGTEEWHFEGKRHRDGGPAIRTAKGHLIWFSHGKLGRLDGPAIVHATDPSKDEWWKGGKHWPEGKHLAEVAARLEAEKALEQAISDNVTLTRRLPVRSPLRLRAIATPA